MAGQSDNPIKRSPIEWLCYLEGKIPYVESSLRSPNSNLGQWVTSFVKFPNMVSDVRAFYEPLGFEVWVESDRKSNLKTLFCKPRNLESVIAYAEMINPGAKKTINHYASDIPSLRTFVEKTLEDSSAILIYDAEAQTLSSYPQFDTFRERVIASLDLGGYQIEEDCFIIGICALLDEYSAHNGKVNINYRVSCNGGGEWEFNLYYEKIKKSDDRIGLPPL